MTEKTRDKILRISRAMFNELGYGKVTLEMLSDAIGIKRGNLWYHFKTKQELIEAITDTCSVQIIERSRIRPNVSGDIVQDYIDFLDVFTQEIREFRFIYRDQADYGEHDPTFLARIPNLYAETERQFLAFHKGLIDGGHLNLSPDRLEALSVNTVILFRFGLEYQRERRGVQGKDPGEVNAVIKQYLTLFDHGLSPSAYAKIQAAFQN